MEGLEEPLGDACYGRYLVVRRVREGGLVRYYAYDNLQVETEGLSWRAIRFGRDGWAAMLHALQIHPCREELQRDPASWPGALPSRFMGAAEMAAFFVARADAHRRIAAHEIGPVGAPIQLAADAPLAPCAAAPSVVPSAAACCGQGVLFG